MTEVELTRYWLNRFRDSYKQWLLSECPANQADLIIWNAVGSMLLWQVFDLSTQLGTLLQETDHG